MRCLELFYTNDLYGAFIHFAEILKLKADKSCQNGIEASES
jgi:hypothetical protein